MIELRRPRESAAADEIAPTLAELVVAFRQVENDTLAAPVIREGGSTFAGIDEIDRFLQQLRRDVTAWKAFQSDTCFIGDDGEVC